MASVGHRACVTGRRERGIVREWVCQLCVRSPPAMGPRPCEQLRLSRKSPLQWPARPRPGSWQNAGHFQLRHLRLKRRDTQGTLPQDGSPSADCSKWDFAGRSFKVPTLHFCRQSSSFSQEIGEEVLGQEEARGVGRLGMGGQPSMW